MSYSRKLNVSNGDGTKQEVSLVTPTQIKNYNHVYMKDAEPDYMSSLDNYCAFRFDANCINPYGDGIDTTHTFEESENSHWYDMISPANHANIIVDNGKISLRNNNINMYDIDKLSCLTGDTPSFTICFGCELPVSADSIDVLMCGSGSSGNAYLSINKKGNYGLRLVVSYSTNKIYSYPESQSNFIKPGTARDFDKYHQYAIVYDSNNKTITWYTDYQMDNEQSPVVINVDNSMKSVISNLYSIKLFEQATNCRYMNVYNKSLGYWDIDNLFAHYSIQKAITTPTTNQAIKILEDKIDTIKNRLDVMTYTCIGVSITQIQYANDDNPSQGKYCEFKSFNGNENEYSFEWEGSLLYHDGEGIFISELDLDEGSIDFAVNSLSNADDYYAAIELTQGRKYYYFKKNIYGNAELVTVTDEYMETISTGGSNVNSDLDYIETEINNLKQDIANISNTTDDELRKIFSSKNPFYIGDLDDIDDLYNNSKSEAIDMEDYKSTHVLFCLNPSDSPSGGAGILTHYQGYSGSRSDMRYSIETFEPFPKTGVVYRRGESNVSWRGANTYDWEVVETHGTRTLDTLTFSSSGSTNTHSIYMHDADKYSRLVVKFSGGFTNNLVVQWDLKLGLIGIKNGNTGSGSTWYNSNTIYGSHARSGGTINSNAIDVDVAFYSNRFTFTFTSEQRSSSTITIENPVIEFYLYD